MSANTGFHSHTFLAEDHASSERRTWAVIWLCGAMTIGEIAGGWLFGSIALVADGWHMSTHAGALLLAAIAYSYAREHADDPRFTFGTGKIGDLAGFTSAAILGMIAILIGYESVIRVFAPVPIHFAEAIPIAALGLAVNVASVCLLGGGGDVHGHSHARNDGTGPAALEIFEDGVPPRFRLHADTTQAGMVTIETERPDGARQTFALIDRGTYLESIETIPEPHAFTAHVRGGGEVRSVVFEEHAHGATHRDNNMRAAVVHVVADAAVSMLAIAGLLLARMFGWFWMDPLAAMIGACVIGSWSYGLLRDTGGVLLDMTPDRRLADRVRQVIENEGDRLADFHLWRLGPGHLGAIVSVVTKGTREADYYHARLGGFTSLSHLTIEVVHKS